MLLMRLKSKLHSLHFRVDFGQVIGDMLGDLMSSVSPMVKVFGNNQKLQKNKQVAQIVEKTEPLMYLMELYTGPSISIT
jgi:hypothetical protein